MPLNVTVTANETFADGSTVDRAALRRAAKPTVSVTGQITTSDLSPTAAVQLQQLENVNEGQIVRGNSSNKPVALALSQGASISSGGVVTPSTNTITGSHLVTGSTNAVNGLSTELTEDIDAANDLVMVHDNSDSSAPLKKVKITKLLNAGVSSLTIDVTSLSDQTSFPATLTIDVSNNPIQTVNITPSAAGQTLTIGITGTIAANTAKSFQIRLYNTHNTHSVGLSFSGLTFLKNTPDSLAPQKYAILALTAFPANLVIAGYAAQS